MTQEPHAWLFGDGSCGGPIELGAWASIAVCKTERKLLTGTACPTTISRCELMPIIEGLQWIQRNWAKKSQNFRVHVYSDSEYTVKTFNGLYQVSKNNDLWRAARSLLTGNLKVEFFWVNRNSLPYMDYCDAIAGNLRATAIGNMAKTFDKWPQPELNLPVENLPQAE